MYDEEFQNALFESDGDVEYANLPEFHRFIIPEGCHWKDVREQTQNIGLAVEKAFRGIEQANLEQLYGIFGDAQWSNKNKLSDRLLTDLIEHFSQYTLSNSLVEPDILGHSGTNLAFPKNQEVKISDGLNKICHDKSLWFQLKSVFIP